MPRPRLTAPIAALLIGVANPVFAGTAAAQNADTVDQASPGADTDAAPDAAAPAARIDLTPQAGRSLDNAGGSASADTDDASRLGEGDGLVENTAPPAERPVNRLRPRGPMAGQCGAVEPVMPVV